MHPDSKMQRTYSSASLTAEDADATAFDEEGASPLPLPPAPAQPARSSAALPPLRPHSAAGEVQHQAMRRIYSSADALSATRRPLTASSSFVQRPSADAATLRKTQSFAVGTRQTELATARTGATLPTLHEEDPPLCGAVSRGGKKRPKSAPFTTAPRDFNLGGGTSAPFHYAPPPMLVPDLNAEVKNAPALTMFRATRDQWQKIHMSTAASPMAGPGAYDLESSSKAMLKRIPSAHFPTAGLKRPASAYAGSSSSGGGGSGDGSGTPGPYDTASAMEKMMLKRTPSFPFQTAQRMATVPDNLPGPRVVQFIEKHSFSHRIQTGPGHAKTGVDPVTAAVPLYFAERPKKHKPSFRFSTAPRFAY